AARHDRDFRALVKERSRAGEADALAAAGDEDVSLREIEIHGGVPRMRAGSEEGGERAPCGDLLGERARVRGARRGHSQRREARLAPSGLGTRGRTTIEAYRPEVPRDGRDAHDLAVQRIADVGVEAAFTLAGDDRVPDADAMRPYAGEPRAIRERRQRLVEHRRQHRP